MGLKNSTPSKSVEIDLIGKGTQITGDITTENSIRIFGVIQGKLTSKNTVTIGQQGVVEGDLVAANAIIAGTVKGKVTVSEKLVLESTSKLTGELKSKKLIIDEGAVFDGTSDMGANPALQSEATK